MGKYYLTLHVTGVYLLDENGEIIGKRSLGEDPSEVAQKILKLETEKVEEDKLLPEITSVVKELLDKDSRPHIILEDEELAKTIKSAFPQVEVSVEVPSKGGIIFRRMIYESPLKVTGMAPEDYRNFIWNFSHMISRLKIKETVEKRDLFIAQAISALDETDKVINLYVSRIREWYGLHFPELGKEIRDHEQYVKIVYELGLRDNMTIEKLKELGIKEDKAKRIVESAQNSMGANMSEFDIEVLRSLCQNVLELYKLRRKLEKYIDESMKDVAPNIRGLVGPLLGARLIALAGGLRRLAMLPASTIQVLGAEKALFRALRTGGKPPKHGVIFTYPAIFRAKKWQRGKIARALAAKLAIAARIDAFTGEYKADMLKSELEKRIEEVKTLYAKPPKKVEKPLPRKPKRKKRKRRSR
ncbi:MAG TPA: C/D box methylation guide ribonucleoprotein complex aNOP56 subunit [Thermoproteales archaeon]|nr:C/D box methylation guide ribonucleoprotein complex aNOP56 subunit [Thermoproteales archaeon]